MPGSGFLLALILGLNMVPGVLTLVPVVMLYHSLGLNNTLAALILPGTFSTGTTFLLICSFRGIPDSLFEAAEIDGANDFQKYAMLGVPLAVPIICDHRHHAVFGHLERFLLAHADHDEGKIIRLRRA